MQYFPLCLFHTYTLTKALKKKLNQLGLNMKERETTSESNYGKNNVLVIGQSNKFQLQKEDIPQIYLNRLQ